jgi:hypothetical protein
MAMLDHLPESALASRLKIITDRKPALLWVLLLLSDRPLEKTLQEPCRLTGLAPTRAVASYRPSRRDPIPHLERDTV